MNSIIGVVLITGSILIILSPIWIECIFDFYKCLKDCRTRKREKKFRDAYLSTFGEYPITKFMLSERVYEKLKAEREYNEATFAKKRK